MAEERSGAIEQQDQGAATVGWQRTLWAMVGIQFVMTGAFSMLSPIMPLFLPVLGVDSASAVALWAGVLAGTTSFVAAFASPLWGRLADRHGRKLMLLRSSIAVGVFAALMGAAMNVWQIFACRALMGVFAGFSSTAIALVASQAPERRLGFALGWLSTGQLVGSLVGPLIGGALADLTGSYRVPFYCTSATILMFDWARLAQRARALHGTVADPRRAINPRRSDRGGPLAGAPRSVLCAADGAVRRVDRATGRDFVRPGADRRAARSRYFERHRLLSNRAFQCHRGILSRQPERRDRLSPGLADLSGGGDPDDPAAGFHRQLLDLHGATVCRGVVHRRHPADRERAGRATRATGAARHGLRNYCLGDVPRQFAGAALRRRGRRSFRAALGVPDDRCGADGKPGVGLLPCSGIHRSRLLNAPNHRAIPQPAPPSPTQRGGLAP